MIYKIIFTDFNQKERVIYKKLKSAQDVDKCIADRWGEKDVEARVEVLEVNK